MGTEGRTAFAFVTEGWVDLITGIEFWRLLQVRASFCLMFADEIAQVGSLGQCMVKCELYAWHRSQRTGSGGEVRNGSILWRVLYM